MRTRKKSYEIIAMYISNAKEYILRGHNILFLQISIEISDFSGKAKLTLHLNFFSKLKKKE